MSHACALIWIGLLSVGQVQPPMPVDPVLKQELARMQGSWDLVSMEENGKKVAADELKQRSLVFIGDHVMLRGPEVFRRTYLLKLGVTKKPKSINATVLLGRERGTTMLGVYDVDGDTMKICIDTEGEERAKDFAAPEGSNRQLLVCKRVRPKDENDDLVGTYRSVSTALDGSEHAAEAVIERFGDAYVVRYSKDGAPWYSGVGIRKGKTFCLSWAVQGQAGVGLFQIESNMRLVGRYTGYSPQNTPGLLETETLTRTDTR